MSKKIIAGFIVSLVCLGWALKGIAWADVSRAFGEADLRWFLIALLPYCCGFFLRATRWACILKPIQTLSSLQVLRPLLLGFFSNVIFPLRLGELIRSYLLTRRFQIPLGASLGSVVTERLTDMIGFLTVFLGAVLLFPFPPTMKHVAALMAVGLGVGLAMLTQLKRHPRYLTAIIQRIPLARDKQARIEEKLRQFLDGTRGLDSWTSAAPIIGLSLIIWMLEGTTLYLLCRAFPNPIPYGAAFFLLFFLGLSVALPQAPGSVGTVEFFGSMALGILGVPKNEALAMTLCIHGFQFAVLISGGVLSMLKEGLSFGDLRRAPPAGGQAPPPHR